MYIDIVYKMRKVKLNTYTYSTYFSISIDIKDNVN